MRVLRQRKVNLPKPAPAKHQKLTSDVDLTTLSESCSNDSMYTPDEAPKHPKTNRKRKLIKTAVHNAAKKNTKKLVSDSDAESDIIRVAVKKPVAKNTKTRSKYSKKVETPSKSSFSSDDFSSDESSSDDVSSDNFSLEEEQKKSTLKKPVKKTVKKTVKKQPKKQNTNKKPKKVESSDSSDHDDFEDVPDNEVLVSKKRDDIESLIKQTEKLSTPSAKKSKSKDTDSEYEPVEISEKKKKPKAKAKMLTYEETVIMLLKREINRRKKFARNDAHKVDLMIRYHFGKRFEEWTRREELEAIWLSLYPEKNVDLGNFDLEEIYEIDLDEPDIFAPYPEFDTLLSEIASQTITSQHALALLIGSLYNFCKIDYRTVVQLLPMSIKEPSKTNKTKLEKELNSLLDHKLKSVWIETYSDKTSFTPSNFYSLETTQLTVFNPTYVYAFTKNYTRDVTAAYAPKWLTETRKLRIPSYDQDWYKNWINFIQKNLPNKIKIEEDEALRAKLKELPFPKNLAEVKSHPLYVIEKHLLKFEALYPKDVEPIKNKEGDIVQVAKNYIYPRTAVKITHTADKWLQEARSIKAGELPYKYVASHYHNKKYNLDPDAKNLATYGKWQTEKYKPEKVIDGSIPRNHHGNVYLYKPEMCPIGGKHIQDHDGLDKVARQLNIDCAKAVVGWEEGRPVPKFDGFIVAKEKAPELLEAYKIQRDTITKTLEKERLEKEKKQAEKRKFECPYCGKMLTRASNRAVHVRLKHPDREQL